jgi:hypothetical protein
MNIKELKDSIVKMEKAMDNPHVTGEVKKTLKKSLDKAREQLKEKESKPKKKVVNYPPIADARREPNPLYDRPENVSKEETPKGKYFPNVKVVNTRPVKWEPRHTSAGIVKIFDPLLKRSSVRKYENLVNFDDKGITGTDSHILLFLKSDVEKSKQGVFCTNKKCLKTIGGKEELKNIKYPNYEEVVPSEAEVSTNVCIKLLQYAIEMIYEKGGIETYDSTPKRKDYQIDLIIDGVIRRVDGKLLKKVLKSLLLIGEKEVRIGFNERDRDGVMFFGLNDKGPSTKNNFFALLMPVMFHGDNENQIDFTEKTLKTKSGIYTCEEIGKHYNLGSPSAKKESTSKEVKPIVSTIKKTGSDLKSLTKKAFFEEMDKVYPDLTLTQATEKKQKEYDALHANLVKQAKQLGSAKPSEYADDFLYKHIPKGSPAKLAKKAPAKKVPAKKVPAKKAPEIKSLRELPKELKDKIYSLNEVVADIAYIAGVQKYYGGDSREDISDFISWAKEFEKKHEKVEWGVDKEYIDTIEDFAYGKIEKNKTKPEPEAKTKPEPEAKTKPEPEAKTKPEPEAKTKPEAKKRTVCTLRDAEDGRRLSKVVKFFSDEAEAWNDSKSSRKITKIVRTKGEKEDIVLEVADYKGMSGIKAFLGERKFYRLCVDSLKLTPVDRPLKGTYNLVVKEDELKKVYTTRGENKYYLCLKTYRKLLKCSFAGTCSAADSKKWKTLYHECGDLEQKLNKNPKALSSFHKEVKKRRKSGEKYSDAMHRVSIELKKELHT